MTHFVPNINYIAAVPLTKNNRLTLYSETNIILVLKIKQKWAGNIKSMERWDVHKGLSGNLREEDYFEDLGIDGKIKFKYLLNK